jgi:hypothetical protein
VASGEAGFNTRPDKTGGVLTLAGRIDHALELQGAPTWPLALDVTSNPGDRSVMLADADHPYVLGFVDARASGLNRRVVACVTAGAP